MTYLTFENIHKAFGEKVILSDVTFSIEENQKIALVAKNGSGKTTLLKILVGQEYADAGKVLKKNNLNIGYLNQDPQFDPNQSIIDSLSTTNADALEAIKLYEESLLHPDDIDAMQNAFDLMERYQAWDLDLKIKDILEHLGLHNIEQKISELSGGQKKRLALAQLLIQSPDLLVLDEPTNHLDLEMIEWLEGYLRQSHVTLFMVTHDRYFLDNICNTIYELENGHIYRHNGNYSTFLENKSERESQELSIAQKTHQKLQKEAQWVNKMPQGRGSKSKLRTNTFFEEKDEQSQLKKYIREKSQKLNIDVKQTYLGTKVVEFSNVDKKYQDKVILDKFNYIFQQKEKIGIIGPNGVGKSTFLNLLLHLEKPDSGYITHGQTVKFGYYNQNGIAIDDNVTIIQCIKDIAEYVTLANGFKATASQILERFLFPAKIQHKQISSLSGGEKRRLYLLTVLLSNPNFLILDEPTNDLDLVTLGILEEFLVNYQGCLIIVSHDRYFMDLIVDHLFIFEGDGVIKDFPGNYTDYREKQKNISEQKIPIIQSKPEITKEQQNQIRLLEKEIKTLENKKTQLAAKFDNQNIPYDDIVKMSEEMKKIVQQIDEKTEIWMQLQ